MSKWNNLETLEHYQGDIWVSKILETENRGNICTYQNGKFNVIAYISPEQLEKQNLIEIVISSIKSYGLNPYELLGNERKVN